MKSPNFAGTACIVFLVLFRLSHSTAETVYSCTFEDVIGCQLDIDTGQRVTWTLGDQMSNAGSQGPTADHTWGSEAGKYVYSSSNNRVTINWAITPKLTTNHLRLPTGEGVLSFYYFLWGVSGNGLNVYVKCDDVTTLLWEYESSGGSIKTWTRAEASLSCNGSFKIMFKTVHNTNNSNIALDDITLTGIKTEAENDISTKQPTATGMLRDKDDLFVGEMTSAPPRIVSTLSTGGVHNRPQETVTLAIILFLLALLFMVISTVIHCYIWQKRRPLNHDRMKSKQISVDNSSYKCPVHTNQTTSYVDDENNSLSLISAEAGTVRFVGADNGSVPRADGGNKPRQGTLPKGPPLPSVRERSKTVPNKRSFECYESIEMEDREEDDKSNGKRVLSDKGDKRKQGFLEKARHFTRSNSLPNSPAGFYESIDHDKLSGDRLAYQVTDLMSDSHSILTLIDDHHSSNSSIPSIPSNYLKPPMTYDNLERRSPLLNLPSRRSPTSGRNAPHQLRLNLSHSHGDAASLYDTTTSSQCDVASLSSYETPTTRTDVSPSVNVHLNPFFQPTQADDAYNLLKRQPGTPSPAGLTDESNTAPLRPQACRPVVTKQPNIKSNYAESKPTPNEYHTLDPDAVSDASFERSVSESSDILYETPQKSKTLQHVKSESSHDYEDLD